MEIKQLLKPTLLAIIGAVIIAYNTGHTQEKAERDEIQLLQIAIIDEIRKDTEQFSFPVVLSSSMILNAVNVNDTIVNFNFIVDKPQEDISPGELLTAINDVFYERKEECEINETIETTMQFHFNFHYIHDNTNAVITKPLSFMCGKNINLI